MPKKYDAIIVGARVAGAATALQLARNGARVLIVDRAKEIGDTLSTHALMRPAVACLDQWRLLDQIVDAGTPLVTESVFHYGKETFALPIKPFGRARGLIAPRRWLLDKVLLEAAVDAGAELRLGTSFDGCLGNGADRVTGALLSDTQNRAYPVKATYLIGADGHSSRVAKSLSARTLMQTQRGSATVYGYFEGLPNRGYEWFFDDNMQAGLIPTTNGAHCVFASCSLENFKKRFAEPFSGLIDAIAHFDCETAESIRANGVSGRFARFGGLTGHLRQAAGPGWALVGDAGYFKDQATAHGITDAFLDAMRLSKAICAGLGLSAYAFERDHHARRMLALSAEIGSLTWTLDNLKMLHLELNYLMKEEFSASFAAVELYNVA